MPANLEQINVSYDAREDRLLLKVRNADHEEYRLWLTRRYTGLLWQVCNRIVRELGWSRLLADEGSKSGLIAQERDAALQGADFATPYEDSAEHYPLGESGRLGYKISFKRRDDDRATLNLGPEEGDGISMLLDSRLLHTLCKMISEAANAAKWSLDLSAPDPKPGARRLN